MKNGLAAVRSTEKNPRSDKQVWFQPSVVFGAHCIKTCAWANFAQTSHCEKPTANSRMAVQCTAYTTSVWRHLLYFNWLMISSYMMKSMGRSTSSCQVESSMLPPGRRGISERHSEIGFANPVLLDNVEVPLLDQSRPLHSLCFQYIVGTGPPEGLPKTLECPSWARKKIVAGCR